jgi:hypothetical protein
MDVAALKVKALALLGTDVPTAQNLMRIAVALAQEVNKASHLTGREKLDAVVRALRGVLAEKVVTDRVSPAELVVLQNVVNDVIPETISLVVEASRGSFQLKKPSIGCVARVGALLCRQVAAHGPGNLAAVATQAASVADKVAAHSEKEVAEAKSDAIELALRSSDQTTDTTVPQEKTTAEPAAASQ